MSKYIFFIFAVFISMCNCGVSNKDARHLFAKDNEETSFVFEVSRIVKITPELGSIRDYTGGAFFGVSSDKSSVWIYEEGSDPLVVLDLEGEGPGKIGAIHNVFGLDNQKFIVFDIKGAHLYNREGKVSLECSDLYQEINVGTIASGFFRDRYSVLVPSLNPMVPLDFIDYYKREDIFFASKVNLKTCDVITFGNVPMSSVYKEKYFPVRQRGFVEPVGSDKILLFFQFDQIIQILDVNTFELIREVTLAPSRFKEVVGSSDRSLQEMTRIAQINPAYIRMKVTADGNYLVTQYTEGAEDFKPTTDYLDGLDDRPDRWIEIYDLRTFEKIGSEISSFPDDAILISAPSLDSIFFYSNSQSGEEGTYLISTSISLK